MVAPLTDGVEVTGEEIFLLKTRMKVILSKKMTTDNRTGQHHVDTSEINNVKDAHVTM